jgi:drug/metabolite transporter (DMT)-like permease
VLVMLSPHFDIARSAANAVAVAGATFGLFGALFSAGSTVQTRALAKSETTSSIVLYFSIICALAGLATLPFGWLVPTAGELAALIAIGIFGGLAHIFLTESYRLAEVSLVAPFDYTSMLWALMLGYLVFSELPDASVFVGAAIIAAAGLFVIWRERRLGLERARDAEGPPSTG